MTSLLTEQLLLKPDRKMYDYVDNEALKKSDVSLTANASYGMTSSQANKQALYEIYASIESDYEFAIQQPYMDYCIDLWLLS